MTRAAGSQGPRGFRGGAASLARRRQRRSRGESPCQSQSMSGSGSGLESGSGSEFWLVPAVMATQMGRPRVAPCRSSSPFLFSDQQQRLPETVAKVSAACENSAMVLDLEDLDVQERVPVPGARTRVMTHTLLSAAVPQNVGVSRNTQTQREWRCRCLRTSHSAGLARRQAASALHHARLSQARAAEQCCRPAGEWRATRQTETELHRSGPTGFHCLGQESLTAFAARRKACDGSAYRSADSAPLSKLRILQDHALRHV